MFACKLLELWGTGPTDKALIYRALTDANEASLPSSPSKY